MQEKLEKWLYYPVQSKCFFEHKSTLWYAVQRVKTISLLSIFLYFRINLTAVLAGASCEPLHSAPASVRFFKAWQKIERLPIWEKLARGTL